MLSAIPSPLPYPFLTNVAELPANSELSVFGAGKLGEFLIRTLRQTRKDVVIRCCIDSRKTGMLHTIPILKPDLFFQTTRKEHLVVIASHFWLKEILALLQDHGFLHLMISAIMPKEQGTHRNILDRHGRDIAFIENRLATARSKAIWRGIIRGLEGDPTTLLELFLERQGQQYLDHVVLNEGDTVVEGGMFDGTNTKQFAQLVGPKGKVIAFDPLPVPVSDLPSQVRVERMALWKEAATLYLVNKGADSSVCRQPGPETVPVQAVGLDGYLQGEHIDYIKLDVEGVEKEVLLGAADTIQRHRPQLAVSIYHSPDDFFQIPQTLFSMCPNYLFYLESYSPSMGDKILIAIPEEKNMTATEIQ